MRINPQLRVRGWEFYSMIEVEICTDVYVEIAVITNKHTIFFNIKCKYANYANYT